MLLAEQQGFFWLKFVITETLINFKWHLKGNSKFISNMLIENILVFCHNNLTLQFLWDICSTQVNSGQNKT